MALVNEHLETRVPGIFAAGYIARWPDPRRGERLRGEHWVVAEGQGQAAARNMLGRRGRFAAPLSFWSQQYDVSIDAPTSRATLAARDVALRFREKGRTLGVSTIFRGRDSLEAELAIKQGRAR